MSRHKRGSQPELNERSWGTPEQWHTSSDLPPLTALAEVDDFFEHVERLVRRSRSLEHGISEVSLEVVPIVTYADSGLPAWTRESRYIIAANILLSTGPEALMLRRLWALDVLEAAGIFRQRDMADFWTKGKVQVKVDPAALPLFSREWYAFSVLEAVLAARHLVHSTNPTEREQALDSAIRAETLFRDYAVKVVHEAYTLIGRRVAAGGPKGASERNKRHPSIRSQVPAWIEWARANVNPAASHYRTAVEIAAHFRLKVETVRSYLTPRNRW